MRDLSLVLNQYGVLATPLLVNDLRIDSREVVEGDCFIAIKGHQLDGTQFAEKAIAAGASYVLAETGSTLNIAPEKAIFIDGLTNKIAHIASQFYQQPSERLKLIGVTGTNGKSTTTAMIADLVTLCGQNGAVIGTLGYGKPQALTPLVNTTPSNVDLQRILDHLSDDFNYVAMEVSSHGLVQGRVAHCHFDVAVFTNLTRDHLDYHGDMSAYAEAKKMLFSHCQPNYRVINVDDPIGAQWAAEFNNASLVVYGKQPASHNFEKFVFISSVEPYPLGTRAVFNTSWGKVKIDVPLYGVFNLYNLAGAFASLLIEDFELQLLAKSASQLKPVPGRMQAFSEPQKPTCIVDYAHTPDALALALQALRAHVPGKLVCVFGCGGDRDVGKRPEMAQAAEQYADKIIITSDNPRTEDPLKIIADVKAGLIHPEYAVCQPDRGSAIRQAIEEADPQSVILIAGKGHEDYQIIGNERIAFCDRQCVEQVLRGERA
ncbi:UDP-N-acetylmuramoyl-L-alanyl-D-glutamate--2,6-diaminopimelate ligase [Pseudoalteromonas sp. T1lg65]|uniref:UDP-N-acetylmuramoyl-L-alanyl-D-glutamate--2, 6-diaminopimelate ligase n=1 Tax=Pseudoalteromonas sp. T1lg65 TaxID=2077101 RepID=UPI003F7A47AF